MLSTLTVVSPPESFRYGIACRLLLFVNTPSLTTPSYCDLTCLAMSQDQQGGVQATCQAGGKEKYPFDVTTVALPLPKAFLYSSHLWHSFSCCPTYYRFRVAVRYTVHAKQLFTSLFSGIGYSCACTSSPLLCTPRHFHENHCNNT